MSRKLSSLQKAPPDHSTSWHWWTVQLWVYHSQCHSLQPQLWNKFQLTATSSCLLCMKSSSQCSRTVVFYFFIPMISHKGKKNPLHGENTHSLVLSARCQEWADTHRHTLECVSIGAGLEGSTKWCPINSNLGWFYTGIQDWEYSKIL